MKEIAIICKGNELAFGNPFFRLCRYDENDVTLFCDKYKDCSFNIHSSIVFQKQKTAGNVLKVFFGEAESTSKDIIYDNYGITISRAENSIICKTSSKKINYAEFLTTANKLLDDYLVKETEYVKQVNALDPKWIIQKFEPVKKSTFLRKKKAKETTMQQYNFIALLLYSELINKFI